MKPIFLHIPKTAGTALKNLQDSDYKLLDFDIDVAQKGHYTDLFNTAPRSVVFCIRDPWQRFASAFYTRKLADKRMQLYEQVKHRKKRNWGYNLSDDEEKQFFVQFPTPDSVISGWRKGLVAFGNSNVTPLKEMLSGITMWLGNLENYQTHEHRVYRVFDTKALDEVFKDLYNVKLPTDNFDRRSQQLFDNEFITYEISDDNLAYFKDVRKMDYKLLNHIRNQTYYFGE